MEAEEEHIRESMASGLKLEKTCELLDGLGPHLKTSIERNIYILRTPTVNPAKKHAAWTSDEDRSLHDRLSRNSTTKGLTKAFHDRFGPTRSEGAIRARNITISALMESADEQDDAWDFLTDPNGKR
ncbi:hypothetical protein NW768_001943 [Fusarium equiseti]|uniref:Myb-like domain-containing protein n=1 Tax=Fusarium equiseti TaxID=61235 RepID=A0ABQ8RM34_FUSEQ|nr:hypothetical protein NW768_001943 [Fusarium equiseti]